MVFTALNIARRVAPASNYARNFNSKASTRRYTPLLLFTGAIGAIGGCGLYFPKYFPDHSKSQVTVLQYQICPHCNKVKSTLDYLKIPYSAIEVNPLTKSELRPSSFASLPTVKFGDKYVANTSTIIDFICNDLLQKDTPNKQEVRTFFSQEALKWGEWANKLSIQLYVNLTSTLQLTKQSLSYVNDVPHFSEMQKFFINHLVPVFMQFGNTKTRRTHKIKNPTESLNSNIDFFLTNLGDKKFLGGDTPHFGDIAIYGSLNSIHNTTLFNLLCTNQKLADWFQRVDAAIGKSSCTSYD